jgi:hypothetical protein
MENEAIQYHRRFDWFQLLYPIVPLGLFFLILRHASANPLQVPGFWVVVGLIATNHGVYFVVAMRSPNRVQLSENELVIGWPNGQQNYAVPRERVSIRRSYLFAGGYRITAGRKSFYLFPGRREGRTLVNALLKETDRGP